MSSTLVIERRPPRQDRWNRLRRTGISREQVFVVVSPVALLVLWEVLSRAKILDPRIFWSPTTVSALMVKMVADGELVTHTAATMQRLVLGTIAGVVPGLVIGLTMGLFRWPRAVINPLVSALYPLPRIALFPLVLLIVGLNEQSHLIMVTLGPFFNMLITTVAAVRNVEPIYLRVARSFETKTWDLYRLVVLPAALPILFSGLKLSLGLGLLGVVAVEFLNTNDELGYLIWHSWEILSLGQSMVGLVTAGLIGFLLFLVLDWLEKRLLPWVVSP